MKIRMFRKLTPEIKFAPTTAEFEAEINEWLENNPDIQIRHIQQSVSDGHAASFVFCITVWYDNTSSKSA